jgi:hypothetical protein
MATLPLTLDPVVPVRTGLLALRNACEHLGRPYVAQANSTLNQHLNILPTATITQGYYPKPIYMAIGDDGHYTDTSNGPASMANLRHFPTDANAWRLRPFVLRPMSNPLTQAERQNYALRREEEVDGVMCEAWYLRKLNPATVVPELMVTHANGDTEPYVYTPGDLEPTKPTIPSSGIIGVSGDWLTCSAVLDATLSAWEINELINVAMLKYGRADKAVISELLQCMGEPRDTLITPSQGAPYTHQEIVCTQVAAFSSCFIQVAAWSEPLPMFFHMGARDPMFTVVRTAAQ